MENIELIQIPQDFIDEHYDAYWMCKKHQLYYAFLNLYGDYTNTNWLRHVNRVNVMQYKILH